jgi:hypothetical protein
MTVQFLPLSRVQIVNCTVTVTPQLNRAVTPSKRGRKLKAATP